MDLLVLVRRTIVLVHTLVRALSLSLTLALSHALSLRGRLILQSSSKSLAPHCSVLAFLTILARLTLVAECVGRGALTLVLVHAGILTTALALLVGVSGLTGVALVLIGAAKVAVDVHARLIPVMSKTWAFTKVQPTACSATRVSEKQIQTASSCSPNFCSMLRPVSVFRYCLALLTSCRQTSEKVHFGCSA